jgi:hypothetical protein
LRIRNNRPRPKNNHVRLAQSTAGDYAGQMDLFGDTLVAFLSKYGPSSALGWVLFAVALVAFIVVAVLVLSALAG